MTVMLDNRVGSGDLTEYFKRWNVPHELTRLDYGDAAWWGNGPDGEGTFPIGVEIKKLKDALNCMTDGRFAGRQLPGLLKDYKLTWLIVEMDSKYFCDYQTGMLMQRWGRKSQPVTLGSRQFMWRELFNWLTTMEVKAGIRVRRTCSRMETARTIADLYGWWTLKDWAKHRSHLAFDEAQLDGHAILVRPNLVRRVAAELPGIGYEKSAAVARKFATVTDLAMATEKEWREIPGVGKGIASKVVAAIEGKA